MEAEFEYDAYISYRKLYENEAQLIADRLKNDGLKVWIDLWQIKPGDRWQEISRQALDRTRAVLVLIGPEGIGPYGQTEELNLVQKSKVKRLIPVVLPDTPPEIVPPQFKDLIWANFRAGLDDESTYIGLVSGIYGDTSNSEPPISTAPAESMYDSDDAKMAAQAVDSSSASSESVSQTDSSEPVIYKARIVVEPLKVRAGPGTSFPSLRTLKKDDLVDVFEEQRDESQNDWGRIGPDQWIFLQYTTRLRELEQPKVKFEYRHRGVLLTVAFTEKGWRMDGIDSLFVTSAKTLNGPEGSFFKAVLDDIPSDTERSNLLNHLQSVITSMPENENIMAISITPELAPVLLPHSPHGKATIITGITSSPQLFDDEEKGEAYVQDIIRKSVVFAGVNGLVHLLMPVVGSQTVAHMERTIQTLTGIREFGSLKNITIVSIAPELVKAARDRFKVLTAEQNNLRQNNRAQAVENDQAQGTDQLGIKSEVDALADTLMLRDVEPPIAVGVMGGWGSGKSFVMYLIKKRIEEIRAKSVKKGWPDNIEKETEIPPYVGHIYQVDFNAWTYAKSNLWASLMDTIFLNLNRQMQIERLLAYREYPPNQTPPTAEDIRTSMLAGGADFKKIYVDGYQPTNDTSLSKETIDILNNWSQKLLSKNLLWQVMRSQNEATLTDLRKNEEELAHLKARQEALEKSQEAETPDPIKLGDGTLARSAYHQLLKTTLLKYVSDTFGSSIRKELKKQNLSEDELLKLQNESKDLLKGFKGLSLAFRQNKYYVYAAFGFAVLTLALPYLFEIFGRPILDYGITKVIAAVSAAVPIVQAFLTRAQKVMEFEQETKEAFESAYENQRESQAEKIVSDGNKTFDEKVQLLEKMSSDGSLPALNALITLRENQIEEQRQQIGPAGKYASLLEFVQSRLDAATYENQLGLMHHVRKDIDELTYSLADKADPKMFPRGKPRVILYIDDLDRCPPLRVVEVLEAIQLLLNTKLFVVILGLDTRYVTRALEKEYKDILQREGDPSGLDYIEKIIQIPYRVRPIEKNGLQNYLQSQMKVEFPPQPAAESTAQSALAASSTPSTQIPPVPKASEQNEQTAPSAEKSDQTPEKSIIDMLLEEDKSAEVELPAAVIQFKPEDLADLDACCQKVALTPRSIKRLVNVLKLMKIFWFRTDILSGEGPDYDRPRTVKQAAIALLALSSSYPEVMREAFVSLENLYRQGKEKTQLFAALNKIKPPPESLHEITWQFQKYKADIHALELITSEDNKKFGRLTLSELNFSTFNLIRSFSFVGDPVYWSDEAEDNARLNGSNPAKPVTKVKKTRKPPATVG